MEMGRDRVHGETFIPSTGNWMEMGRDRVEKLSFPPQGTVWK